MWFSNPAALWAALLIAPLLFFFLLRHRPVRRRVPSLALWAGLSDAHVSTSPFQRLRRSLSLLLFLAALVAMVLALAGLQAPGGRAWRPPVTIVIDATAAMQARGRMEQAAVIADRVIDLSGEVTVLTWQGQMAATQSINARGAAAREAVARIVPVDFGADTAALAAALDQLQREHRRVVFIGIHDPGIPANVRYEPAGNTAPNTGIIGAGLNEDAAGRPEAWFTVQSFGADGETRLPFTLERVDDDGSPITVDARDITLPPGRPISASFPLREPGLYRGRLGVTDALALDDFAYVRYSRLPTLGVHLDEGVPETVRNAVAAIAETDEGYRLVEHSGTNDARLIGNAAMDGGLTTYPAVWFAPGSAPDGARYDEARGPVLARPESAFLWRGAATADLPFPRAFPIRTERLARPVLLSDGDIAAALIERRDGLWDLVMGVDLDEAGGGFTTQPGFVVFWANWLAYAREARDPLPRGALATSETLRPAGVAARVKSPGGEVVRLAPGEGFSVTRQGIYRVEVETAPEPRLVGASLLDPGQSDLRVDPANHERTLEEWLREGGVVDDGEALALAPWLALLAATLLFLEWLFFRGRYPREPAPSNPMK